MTTTERPRIGDFTRTPETPVTRINGVSPDTPKVTSTVPKAEVPESPVAEKPAAPAEVPSKPTDVEQAAKERLSLYQDMQDALVPVTDYKAFLKERDIAESQAEEIIDNLVMRGVHEEEYPLTKRISVKFRTRSHHDTLRLQNAMQMQTPVFQTYADELTVRYNLASSLLRFGDKVLKFPDDNTLREEADKLFDDRLLYIEKLPTALFAKLSLKLAKFDRLINAVMREGVAENF